MQIIVLHQTSFGPKFSRNHGLTIINTMSYIGRIWFSVISGDEGTDASKDLGGFSE